MTSRLVPPAVTPSEAWTRHFQESRDHPPVIRWEQAASLTAGEVTTIARSIQEFQLGERSEGHNLIRAAEAYGRTSGDQEYVTALRLFIGEEQRHSRWLGRVMDAAGIRQLDHTWVDTVFRRLRRLAGLETSICVLLTAEIIAQVYYDALGKATRCQTLQTICSRILEDEEHHVRFQSERLAILRGSRRWASLRLGELAQKILFAGACIVVWRGHHAVLRAGGFPFQLFWRGCWQCFKRALEMMDPASYVWPRAGLHRVRATEPV